MFVIRVQHEPDIVPTGRITGQLVFDLLSEGLFGPSRNRLSRDLFVVGFLPPKNPSLAVLGGSFLAGIAFVGLA